MTETTSPPYKLTIVIPCYNEGQRFSTLGSDYTDFLEESSGIALCFVDDGSTDDTSSQIEELRGRFPDRVHLLNLVQNAGKAEAVRSGMQHCHSHFDYEYIAFLDADLATSLQECTRVAQVLEEVVEVEFAFGSRILKLGSNIKRSKFRFLTGRMVATFISTILQLKVYDTQCGCKVFTRDLADQLFDEKFISKWLFDVELFFRMIGLYGRKHVPSKLREVPLNEWIDRGDSKVKMTYFFKLWFDLLTIRRTYRKR